MGEEIVRERDVSFRIRSNDVVVRPGIIRLEKSIGTGEKVVLD